MVKEIEGKFNVGDTSLYTKTWLVSNTFLPLVIHQPVNPSARPSVRSPTAVTLPSRSPHPLPCLTRASSPHPHTLTH